MDSPRDGGPRPGPAPVRVSPRSGPRPARPRPRRCWRRSAPATTARAPRRRTSAGSGASWSSTSKRHPESLGAAEVAGFLSHLATKRQVSASTQNQAFSALLFLLPRGARPRAGRRARAWSARKRPVRVPLVLSREEVAAVLGAMQRHPAPHGPAHVRRRPAPARVLPPARRRTWTSPATRSPSATARDRRTARTVLPGRLVEPLRAHLERVRRQHEPTSPAAGGSVALPDALDRKYVNAAWEWGWQWVFPAARLYEDPATGRAPPTPPPRERRAEGVRDRRPGQPPHQARHLPHPPPLLRHPPARGRLRHPDHPGAPRPHATSPPR